MPRLTLEHWSYVATIVAALVTAFALAAGYVQFSSTTEAQRDSAAVNLYFEYLKFMREVEKDTKEPAASAAASAPTASAGVSQTSTVVASSRTTPTIPSAIATAGEAIYRLRRGDKGWELTVVNMMKDNAKTLRSIEWDCDTMIPEFVLLLKKHAKIVCMKHTAP